MNSFELKAFERQVWINICACLSAATPQYSVRVLQIDLVYKSISNGMVKRPVCLSLFPCRVSPYAKNTKVVLRKERCEDMFYTLVAGLLFLSFWHSKALK